MNVSVIIRCKNEEKWIGHCIQSVLDHSESPQLVIIDNNSDDDSMDVVRMFKHHADIKHITIDEYSPGKSLNLGVRESKHEVVIVLSAHCVVSKLDLSKIHDQLNSHCVVFGKQIPYYRGRRIGQRYIWRNFRENPVENMFSGDENRYFLHNAFSLYRKETLIEHPFDEILYGKEDRYWVNDMIAKGHHSLYDPQMACAHHWTPSGATWKGIG